MNEIIEDEVTIKVLNLYAGIGGNRKLWPTNIEVTAVESNPQIAAIYHDFFPNDIMVVGDAHQYLLDHFKEFDFIWSSIVCKTHSRTQHFLKARIGPVYPDMRLYEEIIFLTFNSTGKWVVENVISYYGSLENTNIKPPVIADNHYFWANFPITPTKNEPRNISSIKPLAAKMAQAGIILPPGTRNRRELLRNCVMPKTGLHIFNSAFNPLQKTLL